MERADLSLQKLPSAWNAAFCLATWFFKFVNFSSLKTFARADFCRLGFS